MKQQTLAQGSFELYRKPTKREKFLNDMEQVIPWQALHDLLMPYYPKAGNGRPPVGLMKMLRLHFLQHWYNLSDPGLEEALYESESVRRFAGSDLGCEPVPDETTILRFRRMLEEYDLGRRLFAEVGRMLQERGIKVSGGTIVDATIIAAPSSTKNADKERDPEMRSTKKGNQWHFGMKLHIGVDSKTGLIHSAAASSANVHDSEVLPDLLHGNETRVYGDSAYRDQAQTIRRKAPRAKDFTQARAYRNRPLTESETTANRTKSTTRAKVEHPFLVIKRLWGFSKVRYRGIAKNATRTYVACALANLFLARRCAALQRV
ncbi:IS5 family transposase [Noviherbaspirillum sp. CPCC 100848]|jgi:IS5 family transposase|uniref:IS5 family transposase n=1 Tax=Noviherbaspirillum album TaxID=3080276 RepID=A0ABU6J9N0_9BURK|nr:IS5 family transposase [Noviherbaspirillum sp. CPCC 100848]MEC4720367.1 IS5 family transposase [Noviherbaspirillum sp. CPCC 100848]